MASTSETASGPAVGNPYAPMSARLAAVIQETPTIKTFVVEPERPLPFLAGQFVQITVPGVGEAPFTPSSSPHEPDRIEVTVLRTGLVTDAMHKLEPGVELGIRGPFGKGYHLESFEGKDLLLVGGGVGLAPLRALIFALLHNLDRYRKVIIKYGARAPQELLFSGSYDRWRVHDRMSFEETIDVPADGWTGHVGLVTTLLRDLPIEVDNSVAVSCGPQVMLRFVTLRCLELGYQPSQIWLSMNRRMSCGIGKCGRCNIGPYYLCKDGPDMNYEQVKDYPNVF